MRVKNVCGEFCLCQCKHSLSGVIWTNS